VGYLIDNDSTLFRNFFKEMAFLRGISVQYQYSIADQETVSIHGEIKPVLSSKMKMNVIFDENPKVETLKKIGWVSEYPDSKPIICMVPFDAPNLTTECVISIPPFKEINSRSRMFKVTAITTILEYPDCWTCTLAPIFDDADTKDTYEDSNYNYAVTTETPTEDTSSNNYTFLKVDP